MNFRSVALSVLSGILLALAFPLANAYFLAWIALIPLFFALKNQSVKNGFWLGGITGLVYFAGTVHWVTNSVHFYGHIPLIPASLVTLLLCVYLALYPALFGAASVQLRKRSPRLFFISAAALWTALELARTYVFSGFPWSLLGYSQFNALPVIQISNVTGVYGVSFLIVLVNATAAELFVDKKYYGGAVAVACVMAGVLGYGYLQLRAPEQKPLLKISVVQGNIEQDKKWDPAYQEETLSTYKRLTLEALAQKPDLVIWPETATPFYFNGSASRDSAHTADLVAFVKRSGVPLLFGSPTYEVTPNKHIIGRNSAFLLNSDSTLGATYHKIHLVPFGEYVPLKSLLFFVEKMVQAIGDFQAGDDYAVMTVQHAGQTTKLSTVICYEIIFPDLVRRFVANGANVITTVTNDAWFGRTAAPYQHFSMAVFRAVENRVPVARAANTGISGFIDSKGTILETSGIFKEARLTHAIAPGHKPTFYTRFGDVFSYLCAAFTLIMMAGQPGKKR